MEGPEALTFKFLWESASNVKADGSNSNIKAVQAGMRIKCAEDMRMGSIDYTSLLQPSEICHFCGTPWDEGNLRIRIQPHKQKMKKFYKKLLSKQNLSKYEQSMLDFFSKRKDNILERKCMTCKKSRKLGLNKPNEKAEDVSIISSNDTASLTPIIVKKKKKKPKKDRFSGLLPSAVMNARFSHISRDSSVDTHSTSTCDQSLNACSLVSEMSINTPCSETKNNNQLLDSNAENSNQNIVNKDSNLKPVDINSCNSNVITKKNKRKKKKQSEQNLDSKMEAPKLPIVPLPPKCDSSVIHHEPNSILPRKDISQVFGVKGVLPNETVKKNKKRKKKSATHDLSQNKKIKRPSFVSEFLQSL